jgi:hypothetical protein
MLVVRRMQLLPLTAGELHGLRCEPDGRRCGHPQCDLDIHRFIGRMNPLSCDRTPKSTRVCLIDDDRLLAKMRQRSAAAETAKDVFDCLFRSAEARLHDHTQTQRETTPDRSLEQELRGTSSGSP